MDTLLASSAGPLSRCDDLRAPGVVNLIVSMYVAAGNGGVDYEQDDRKGDKGHRAGVPLLFILVGMLVSYLPQHIRIIARGTSEGISPYFVLLGVTSATSGFANILTLPQSLEDVACCKELDTFHCMAGLLGIAQLGVQWICFAFILALFLVFFRFDDANVPIPEEEIRDEQPRWQTAVLVAYICLLHGLLVIALTAVFATVFPQALSGWANALGLMAALLAAVQYFPQIHTTYRLKHVGSLSIPMMCMQTPGGFVFAASLFVRLGWGGWSSWGIFLLTATMQGILLSMAIYYELQRAFPDDEDSDEDSDDAANVSGNGNGNGRIGGNAHPKVHRPLYRRVLSYRSARLDENTPSRYSAHPEHYGTTPDEISDIIDRQDSDAATETQPLLRPGGIGNPRRENDARRRSGH
ncbi:pq loop repeat protein [Grosmannia clavigera kw1407]|uniref:Pq loop repeat protein n=1 Tax=Grosmannia clavigera (strain kw1407 / UAMH 11150) TaxID=655863 RepID=F0X8E0_GROCL|nr:pq loop repeat protein [Grosmannia clavigera kw1407]EFX05930.1 pq loop repeat protein [Grosmannia clavigera kw1407]